ncbi:MAG TPA: delta-60 repeat domain-containing protein [Blastocatellia bacterium]|nr:delta-60 repeat domain-containing protein [Blastocatellia bacterium]
MAIRRSQKSYRAGVILALVVSALLSPRGVMRRAHAATGDLDPAFGNGGKVVTDLGGYDSVRALAIQNDGKIIAAGTTGSAFALARYNVGGGLDPDFGDGGKVITRLSASGLPFDRASAIILQPDGKIVAGGSAYPVNASPDFALARYRPDGSLDKSFGSGGKVTTDFTGFNREDEIFALAIQPDGKIVAAGYTSSPRFVLPRVFGLARYNPDGSLDTTFGNGGKVATISFFGSSDYNEVANALAIQPDGKIVVAGFAADNFAIARLNPDGSLDVSFGSGGRTTPNFGGIDEALAIALKPGGNLLVAGRSTQGVAHEKLALAYFDTFGGGVAGFGVGGQLMADFFSVGSGLLGDGLNAITFQSDGKIVAAGYGNVNGDGYFNDFGVARYNEDGTPDSSFGSGGKVSTDFGGPHDVVLAVAVQLDGKVVAAGHTEAGDFALARYTVAAPPDFAIGFNATQVTASRGTKVPIVVNVNRTGGFAGAVTVTPPDVSALKIKMIPPDPVTTTEAQVTFKAKIKGGAPTGVHELTFTATDAAGRSRSATLRLQIE